MKVIQQGPHPNGRPYRGRCPDCGSLLEAPKGELRRREGDEDVTHWIQNCPVCNATVYFTEYTPSVSAGAREKGM